MGKYEDQYHSHPLNAEYLSIVLSRCIISKQLKGAKNLQLTKHLHDKKQE